MLDPREFDAVENEISDGLIERLNSLGILSIAAAGNPSSETREGHVSTHLRPAVPARHLQSRYQRFVGERAFAQLLRDSVPAT